MPDDTFSGSWLAARLGMEPRKLDAMRRGGHVIALRAPGSQEWRYPAWQFDRSGTLVPGIDRVVTAARDAGVADDRLARMLSQRAGLVQGGRPLGESLRDGNVDHVVAAVRSAS